jgi:propanol-preferring alcohol dehydrogenase
MVADERDCVKLPDQLSFAVGAYCSCGAGTAYQVTKRLGISGLDDVVIFGVGPVGLAATLFATFEGGRVIAVDVNEQRLELAKAIGAKHVINPNKEDPVEKVFQLTHGEGASVTMDCSANPTARVAALECAKVWGRTAYVGEGNTTTIDPSPQILHKELTLIGSWVFSLTSMMELLEYLARYSLPLEHLITDRFQLENAPQAFEAFAGGQTAGKAVFEWS